MATVWRRVNPMELSTYFAWYEAVPGFIHFLRGEEWKQDEQGWMFKTTMKKHCDLMGLRYSFEREQASAFKKYWLKQIANDPDYWIIVKREPHT